MKPKYSLKNNFLYAVDGLKFLLKENAFKIEITFFLIFTCGLYFLALPIWSKMILFSTLFLPLFAEAINTSIEKVVDLVTDDFHPLAKQAKDIAAFGVVVSIIITFLIWITFFIYYFDLF